MKWNEIPQGVTLQAINRPQLKSHEKKTYLENKPGFVQSVRSPGISLQQNIT